MKKTVLITGAGSGIGEAIAKKFASNGFNVVVSDIDTKGGKRVVKEIEMDKGSAFFIKADTSNPKECEKLVKQTVKKFGDLHVAVNNAGIGGEMNKVADYSIESWRNVIDINLNGVFFGCKYQIPAIEKSGGGSIINMASILGMVGTAYSSSYVAAKHGILGLTKSAAIEYAQNNVRINAVGPGYISTPLLSQIDESQKDQIISLHPMGRLGKSEEVANLVYWLGSDEASFVTGSYYTIDGGYTAQ